MKKNNIKDTWFLDTEYGFIWQKAEIQRTASLPDGSIVLCISTPRESLHIRVTKTGLIRTEEVRKK